MNLIEEKQAIYDMKTQGEEIIISEAAEFLECSICKSCVHINQETMAVIDISSSHDIYQTIILYRNKLPVVTKESSSDILLRHRKKRDSNYQFSKLLIKSIFGKNRYLHAYMTKNDIFIPLEGESKGYVSYFNLTFIDGASSYNQHESIISFTNDLELRVPRPIKCVKNKQKMYLESFITYTYSLAYIVGEEENFNPFQDWEGLCYQEYKGLIQETISKIDNELIVECLVKNNMANTLKETQINRLFEEHYIFKSN